MVVYAHRHKTFEKESLQLIRNFHIAFHVTELKKPKKSKRIGGKNVIYFYAV